MPKPVMFPPGRSSRAMRALVTGSPALAKMIGIPAAAPTYTGECLALEDRFMIAAGAVPVAAIPARTRCSRAPRLSVAHEPRSRRAASSRRLCIRVNGGSSKRKTSAAGARRLLLPQGADLRDVLFGFVVIRRRCRDAGGLPSEIGGAVLRCA